MQLEVFLKCEKLMTGFKRSCRLERKKIWAFAFITREYRTQLLPKSLAIFCL